MSLKDFYLYALVLSSLFGSIALFSLYFSVKPEDEDPKKRGILFLSLAILSWAFVGIYQIVDPTSFSIINTITNRVLSMFSNICMLGALPYFPWAFSFLHQRIKIFRNSEQWLSLLMLLFSGITILFVFLDRNDVKGDFIDKYIIILIDSFLSILSLSMISYAIYSSAKRYWSSPFIRFFCVTSLLLFLSTQIAFPIIGFFPESINIFYYHLTLVVFLVSLNLFIAILFSYYSLTELEKEYASKSEKISEKDPIVSRPTHLVLDYNAERFVYELKIGFTLTDHPEVNWITLESKKILKPFASWFVFALASKFDVPLTNINMAINKFRMVDFWNKESEQKLDQELIFRNESGNFSLKLNKNNITINNLSHFQDLYIIREVVANHWDAFKKILPEAPEGIDKDRRRRDEWDQFIRKVIMSAESKSLS